VADLLVRRGLPFRQAHGVVAGLVRTALDGGKTLSELEPDELREHSPLLDQEFYSVFRDGAALESKVSRGGTSLTRVREQLERVREAMA
jgi:argininosuccinate lyase